MFDRVKQGYRRIRGRDPLADADLTDEQREKIEGDGTGGHTARDLSVADIQRMQVRLYGEKNSVDEFIDDYRQQRDQAQRKADRLHQNALHTDDQDKAQRLSEEREEVNERVSRLDNKITAFRRRSRRAEESVEMLNEVKLDVRASETLDQEVFGTLSAIEEVLSGGVDEHAPGERVEQIHSRLDEVVRDHEEQITVEYDYDEQYTEESLEQH